MTMYLLTVKHHKEESLKAYLAYFKTERLTTHDQEETINLATFLGGIWLENPILKWLAQKTTSTLKEFMDQVEIFLFDLGKEIF